MRLCSGVFVTRIKKNQVQFLMVKSTTGGNWVHPKGGIEGKLNAAQSAAKEAYEEAGVIGAMGPSLGTVSGFSKGEATYIEMFHMQAAVELDNYPEVGIRERKWFDMKGARKHTKKNMQVLLEFVAMQAKQQAVVKG